MGLCAFGVLTSMGQTVPVSAHARMTAAMEGNAPSGGIAVSAGLSAIETPALRVQPVGPLVSKRGASGSIAVKKAPASRAATDISGYYVGTYSALASSSFPGGSSMQIVPDAEGDSLTIRHFWSAKDVRAYYDKAAGTVSIKSQYILTDENLGALNLAMTNHATGAPEYEEQLVGTVLADGTIDFSDAWWGVYVQSGKDKDKFVGAYDGLVLRKPNGTMTYKSTNSQGVEQTINNYVIINQTSPNTLSVCNIFGRGLEVEVVLNRNRTATFDKQVALINSAGEYALIKCLEFDQDGNLTKYSTKLTTDIAPEGDDTRLKWNDWSLLNALAKSYAGRLGEAVLKADKAWSYPALNVSGFEGSGTEADPYLIKSLDHLLLMSDEVNNDPEHIGGSGSGANSRTYLGKHFAFANDIDMQNYLFTPIGNSWYQRFAGSVDGRNHTVKGLRVESEGNQFSGLFGMCDTTTVLKNIVVESPVVKGSGTSAGLVAWTNGSISNVTVNNPDVYGGGSASGGIVGIVTGLVSDCRVNGGEVAAKGYLGGIAGEAHGGMRDCAVNGTRIYESGVNCMAGGVVGNLMDADGSGLSFYGLVAPRNVESDGSQMIGGVAGVVQNVTLSNSFAGGVVRTNMPDSQLGGVTGVLSSGTLENCYSSGFVSVPTAMGGGLVGLVRLGSSQKQPRVVNCYTSATVDVNTYNYDTAGCREVIGTILDGSNTEIVNVYYDKQVTDFKSTRFGATTSELTSANGLKGFSSDVWTFTEGAYPRIKSLADTEAALFTASAVVMGKDDSFKKLSNNTPVTALGNTKFLFANGKNLTAEGHYAKIIDNKTLEIGTEFGADTLYVVNGDVQTFHLVDIAPIPFEGSGTAESPFLIRNKADMIALGEATSAKGQTFRDFHFAMTADIDMEHDEAFIGISVSDDVHSAFEGVFDGQGHTIDNISMNKIVWATNPTPTKDGKLNTSASKSYAGLFGRVAKDGVVRNVNVGAGSKFVFYGYSGAIVGDLSGRIENCRNYADVVGYSSYIAGVAGYVQKTAIVTGSYNAGDVLCGNLGVGGIAGNNYGTIDGCANTGDIAVKVLCTNYVKNNKMAGGIVGTSNGAIVRNCVNYGTVYAEKIQAGGIAGSMDDSFTTGIANNDIENCLNLGNVYCGDKATVGAVLGQKGTKVVKNVYFDAQTIGIKAGENSDVENMYGLETSALVSGDALDGLTTDAWDYKSGEYPALKIFASEAEVAAARKVVAFAKSGEVFTELGSDVTLGEGVAWSIVEGSSFKIDGNKLVVPVGVKEIEADTLVAVNEAGVRRPIFVQALPAMPLAGEGTEAAPYLVGNADDWKALADYMTGTGKTLQGKFIKVTADIDFGDTDPVRVGASEDAPLAATFDGAGHIFKGLALKSSANQKSAIFGIIAAEGTVKNLTVEGKLTATHTHAAPVVDKLYGTLQGVTSNVVVSTNKANASGVAGYAYEGALLDGVVFGGSVESNQTSIGGVAALADAFVNFKNCEFKGRINQTGSYTKATEVKIGGICGVSGASTFEGCLSNGEITVASPERATVIGGIVGIASGAKGKTLYTFTGCRNATSISAAGKIGGIVGGTTTTAANAQYVMTDCSNTGDLSAESTSELSSSPIAGIITNWTPGSSFTRCYNEGTIISNMNRYAAGITGYYYGTPGATATPQSVEFTDCYNSGMIVCDAKYGYAAGIAGAINGKVTMTRCYNTGDIEGTCRLGGLVSYINGDGMVMTNSYNTGNVTAKAEAVGGLIAYGTTTNGVVEGCWNSGNISSTSSVQSITPNQGPAFQIGGLAGYCAATFRNCYNVGAVKGLANVAGLVACPSAQRTTKFINCYNAGKIDAPADSCGSIIGVKYPNDKYWSTDNAINSMENCYYLDINMSDNDAAYTGAKAVTRAQLAALDLGDGFASVDDYTHPVVKEFADHKVALFHAAELVLADGDTFDNVTHGFNVGGGSAVTWSSDCADLAFDGVNAYFAKAFTGAVKVTASAGELSKSYELVANNATSSIDSVDGDDADVTDRRYIDLTGVEVPAPAVADGKVYVVVETLVDGTTRTTKIINK
ncbi:hypothetical protein [uncultured Muribaculum sp.]|uniref:hypothetical protein n=1 Tax=uncultured Muribaculum sp. TaxID=1918613 RepID=UPI00262F66AF|nr:hypothetical protein [uncultured Muribaculum sp.]